MVLFCYSSHLMSCVRKFCSNVCKRTPTLCAEQLPNLGRNGTFVIGTGDDQPLFAIQATLADLQAKPQPWAARFAEVKKHYVHFFKTLERESENEGDNTEKVTLYG
ncbi:hypothetical protein SAMN06298226_0050 [Nitrosovibrio sp. Nv4]|nr:hypothetical protein SAMN06298226_0050 [Nitrosovibrio sp. Nv4]